MKKSQIAKIVIFPITLILVTYIVSVILCCPGTFGAMNYATFYHEPKNSLDVVFVGPSTVYDDFIPTYAYEKYGYTSYNYASAGQTISVTKYSISEIIRMQNPQLIVVDLNSVSYTTEEKEEISLREFIDSIPNSNNKKRIRKETGTDKDISFDIKLLQYHNNWKDPASVGTNAIFNIYKMSNKKSYLKGFCSVGKIWSQEGYEIVDMDDQTYPIGEYNETKLRELIEYCNSLENQKFVFVRYPRFSIQGYNENSHRQANYVRAILAEYGYDYTDFSMDMADYLDPLNDYADPEHLNYYGARKFTDKMSEFLIDNYGLEENKDEKVKNEWDKNLNKVNDFYEKLSNMLDTSPIQDPIYISECNIFVGII